MLAGHAIGRAVATVHEVDVPVPVAKVGDDEDVRIAVKLPELELGGVGAIEREEEEIFDVNAALVVVYGPTVPLLEIHCVVKVVVEVAGHVL